MAEALAALVFYDPEADAAVNAEAMTGAAEAVATGEITQAVRDTNTDVGPVKNGDWIGLVRGDGVVAVGGTMVAATTQLLDTLITPGRELLTMITGDLATARQIEEVIAYLSENHPDVEVEVHAGGQPLYPFLFGVE
jgi:dihydroxyacetone kinase-like predicted kinase